VDEPADWKRYPYVPDWGDTRCFTLPRADGHQPELGIATYFIDGFLRGRTSGRSFAFIVIVTDMRVLRKRVRASFYTFALYDLDRRHYGTYTDYDFPRPPRIRRRYKIHATPGRLHLRFEASAGVMRWENRQDQDGQLVPFAWTLALPGVDQHDARMSLELSVDAGRPPAPLGGRLLDGEMMFLGAPRTYSYFQSGLEMRGRLAWGDLADDVEGHVGWIDRQWAPDDFTAHQDWRSTRYRNEWRVIQLDDGWDMSCFHQYQRDAHAAIVPWTGLSAQGPAPEFVLRATPHVQLTIPEFIRSPGLVRGMSMVTEGPRWFPHRYRLRAPRWGLDLQATPLVDAPAHRLPIEYWTGPVRIEGSHQGRPVTGWGFDERSRPWTRGDELARALRLTIEHVDELEEDVRERLAYRTREVEALALRGDPAAAADHLRRHIQPWIAHAMPSARELAADVLVALSGRFRTR
jgi:hypothetical protein